MSSTVLTDSGLRGLSEEALNFMIENLAAERAVVLLDNGETEWSIAAIHGIARKNFWTSAPLSLSILEDVIASGEPHVSADAQRDHGELFSLQVSEIRSFLCVPLFRRAQDVAAAKVAGLFYCDIRFSRNILRRTELERLAQFGRRFQKVVFGWPQASAVEQFPSRSWERPASSFEAPVVSKKLGPLAPRPSKKQEGTQKHGRESSKSRPGRVSQQSKVVFFRSLATMMNAGVVIHEALALLSENEESPALARASSIVSESVRAGNSLSQAMSLCPWAFGTLHIQLIGVAERSGALGVILERLAGYEEWSHRLHLKLRSSLTYPVIVACCCMLLVVLIPPFVLKPQLALIAQMGIEPPFLTKVLMMFAGPLALLPPLFAALLFALFGFFWSHPTGRGKLFRFLLRVPGVGEVLRISSLSRFGHALSIQLDAGVLLTQALPLAANATENPLVNEQITEVVEHLEAGCSFSESLAVVEFFPEAFLKTIASAEESASVPAMLTWISALYDTQVESAVDAYVSLFEPVMMLLVGSLVGAMVLGTMLPLIQVLQSAL